MIFSERLLPLFGMMLQHQTKAVLSRHFTATNPLASGAKPRVASPTPFQ
jgi:hypothetical protein